jgi:hypothetical protein
MRARRQSSLGRGFEQFLHAGSNEFLFLFDGFGYHAFGGQYERYKDRRALVVREPIAAVNQLFDCDVHWWHECRLVFR